MSERLQTWLRGERVLPEGELQAAVERQSLYGGGLDTAILERGTMTETAVWARLAAATGLPAPRPALCDPARLTKPPALDAALTGPLRAVPVAVEDGTVDLLCAEPIVEADIRAAVHERGLRARLYVIPETRLLAMRQHLYGEPLPARYVPLLARAVGVTQARTAYAAPPRPQIKSTTRTPTDGQNAFLAHAVTEVAPPPPGAIAQETEKQPVRSPISPKPSAIRGPVPAGARSTTRATGGGNAAATPLEHVLDLSGPLSMAAASEEVEVQPALERQLREAIVEPRGGVHMQPEETAPNAGESGGDPATEALCRRARDPADRGRPLALRALRRRLTHPATQILLAEFRSVLDAAWAAAVEPALLDAIEALAEMRDGGVVRALIRHLDGEAGSRKVAAAARRGLVALTAQDFGMAQKPWQAWAEGHAEQHRVEWLLEGLAHKRPEIRMAAAEDLRPLAGESFGYAFNGPKREREAARQRFVAWWQGISRPERVIPE